ncbi:MAG: hypothetical protein AAGI53_03845 [Planctomycetota bacterium]
MLTPFVAIALGILAPKSEVETGTSVVVDGTVFQVVPAPSWAPESSLVIATDPTFVQQRGNPARTSSGFFRMGVNGDGRPSPTDVASILEYSMSSWTGNPASRSRASAYADAEFVLVQKGRLSGAGHLSGSAAAVVRIAGLRRLTEDGVPFRRDAIGVIDGFTGQLVSWSMMGETRVLERDLVDAGLLDLEATHAEQRAAIFQARTSASDAMLSEISGLWQIGDPTPIDAELTVRLGTAVVPGLMGDTIEWSVTVRLDGADTWGLAGFVFDAAASSDSDGPIRVAPAEFVVGTPYAPNGPIGVAHEIGETTQGTPVDTSDRSILKDVGASLYGYPVRLGTPRWLVPIVVEGVAWGSELEVASGRVVLPPGASSSTLEIMNVEAMSIGYVSPRGQRASLSDLRIAPSSKLSVTMTTR